MDLGIWATWYDLPERGKEEYLSWLHEVHIPEMLSRPGYLWAAHMEHVPWEDWEVRSDASMQRYLGRTPLRPEDPSVPAGNEFLILYGAASPQTFVDPTPAALEAKMTAEAREMLGRRVGSRSCIFLEVARVDGPEAHTRAPEGALSPAIQISNYNVFAGEDEDELCNWYARFQLPKMSKMPGCVGAHKLVSISGWGKHGSLYEFVSVEAVDTTPPMDQADRLRPRLVHAPGSPARQRRIWPPA